MGTDKTALEEVVRGGTTGSDVTGSDRKYVLRTPFHRADIAQLSVAHAITQRNTEWVK
jgi:hypothetical protein